jgi:hypothetical protein
MKQTKIVITANFSLDDLLKLRQKDTGIKNQSKEIGEIITNVSDWIEDFVNKKLESIK